MRGIAASSRLAGILCWLILLAGLGTGWAQERTRADFLRIIERPHMALEPRVESSITTNGLVQCRFSFVADARDRVPGILIEPANLTGRHPAVIALHGTGGSKASMLSLCEKLAERGFVAVAIDGRYHGDRKTGRGQTAYNDAMVRAWQGDGEHPFFYDTVWDVMRLVDYLQTRDDVDGGRIGLTGISKGGVETYLAAAADPRIACAVPCIGMQSFHWALVHEDWQGRIGTIQPGFDEIVKREGVTKPDAAFVKKFYDRVAPGIDSEFDGPEMIGLIAPRPLLLINSDSDNHTPLAGVNECVEAAEQDYAAHGAKERFAVIIQKNTGHQVLPKSEQALIEWFVRWLRP